jgi:hypothetical protein
MISSWTDVLIVFDQLDSGCRAAGCLLPCRRDGVSIFSRRAARSMQLLDEGNFFRAVVLSVNYGNGSS